ncbi:hypothetical protein QBC36DRAFT_292669 [Triangularia setosa]|uniref:Uncharacterized protein n=1 Tax=Triangularia setosa TaxID=2587417 RepID=A0AAN7A6J3_9PEZI|nr:hypothetical protein QBC36DRAFT_292669 [Podospora setosa]
MITTTFLIPKIFLLLLAPLVHTQSPPITFTRTLFLDNFTTYTSPPSTSISSPPKPPFASAPSPHPNNKESGPPSGFSAPISGVTTATGPQQVRLTSPSPSTAKTPSGMSSTAAKPQEGPCDEFVGIGNTVPGFTRTPGQFHTIAVEIDRTNPSGNWREETLSWWVDGKKTFEVNDERAWTAVTRGKKFIILNLAVGGDFPDNIANEGGRKTPTTETRGGLGAKIEVRYVAVYST